MSRRKVKTSPRASGGGCCRPSKLPEDINHDTNFDEENWEEPGPDVSNQIQSRSRVYADALRGINRKQIDHHKFQVEWNSEREVVLGRKVGQGHFSNVYAAIDVETNQKVVAKVLKRSSSTDKKIIKEIMVLEYVRGGPNIVELIDTVVDEGKQILLFEKVNYVPSEKLFRSFSPEDVRYYGYQLLKALDYTHSRGVMHRDVKPANVLIDPVKRILRLADWGVAGFYFPNETQQRGPGTRNIKAPEVSLRWDFYDYACDLWAFGLFFGAMIFHHHGSLVRGQGGWFNQIRGIAEVVGVDPLVRLMEKLRIRISRAQMDKLRTVKQVPMRSRISESTRDLCTDDALDLLAGLLECDPTERFTAKEAMAHAYFASVDTGSLSEEESSSGDAAVSSAYPSGDEDSDSGSD